jgi:hypothetical protein
MPDAHLKILRAVAHARLRRLAAHDAQRPDRPGPADPTPRATLERQAARARRQLSGAKARRSTDS